MNDLNAPLQQWAPARQSDRPIRVITPDVGVAASTVNAWRHVWQRMKTRRALRELDAAQLKDVGLTRQQALEEAYRPFWQLFRQ